MTVPYPLDQSCVTSSEIGYIQQSLVKRLASEGMVLYLLIQWGGRGLSKIDMNHFLKNASLSRTPTQRV